MASLENKDHKGNQVNLDLSEILAPLDQRDWWDPRDPRDLQDPMVLREFLEAPAPLAHKADLVAASKTEDSSGPAGPPGIAGPPGPIGPQGKSRR
mmetsp:Transcript_48744/g.153014  ORF Transcript_48744/g.153014 Transcript_48744/m.153014 type:complete len:95 (+) Transcript_48744:654-938(+)